ncbi:uncharacterized protein LOC130719759 [Lotus japonicus]|uniref:uncharacterized protein LOC130719759 n=1 Tax=Lotus japonicus TaxID=34305 RepID=UPI00258B7BBC|nr:uncharacterized protein LOC130719759 [Lotus japonicus]
MSSEESAPVIDGLKEEIFRVVRDKVNLELEVKQLTESLKVSRNEEARMRAKILKLEESVGMAAEKEEGMARKYSALVSEKNEMERMLTEKRDSHEYEIAELLGEVGRVRDVMDEFKGSHKELQEKNEQLLSQVDEVMLEKDNMTKGFEMEKDKVENLELEVAGMKGKLEQAEAKLGKMRNERGMLNKRNKELENNVDVLKKEKEALQNTLLQAQRESGDLNKDVGNKRSSPTEEETSLSLRKKGKFELSHVKVESVLESDHVLRMSKEDNCCPLNSNSPSGLEISEYPDTDFKDFDKDRGEDCFDANQIWALYDNLDMPRIYAIVRKVATPFKLMISWLEPDPDDEGELDWYYADLPIACGKFILGDSENVTDREIFSHQIPCMNRTGRGSYMVYPKKGETWAIFRDWDIKWSSNPENHFLNDFEYVEILSDFTENVGIEVARLVKVEGFVSLFQKAKKKGVNMFFVVPNELYRFSHRIPSYKMTGIERKGVPRGCFELDTAALPANFFKVGESGVVKM